MLKRRLFSLDFIAFFIKIFAILGIITLIIMSTVQIVSIINLINDYKLPGNDYTVTKLAYSVNYIFRYIPLFNFKALGTDFSAIQSTASFYPALLLDKWIPLLRYLLQIGIAFCIFLFARAAVNNQIKTMYNSILMLIIALLFIAIPISKIIIEYLIYLEFKVIIPNVSSSFNFTLPVVYLIGFALLLLASFYLLPQKSTDNYFKYALLAITFLVLIFGIYQITNQINVIIQASKVKETTYYDLRNKHNPFLFLYFHRFNIYYTNYSNIPSDAILKPLYVFQTMPNLILTSFEVIVLIIFIIGLYKLFVKKFSSLYFFMIASLVVILIPFIFMGVDYIIYKLAWNCFETSTITYNSLKSLKTVLPINYDYFILAFFFLLFTLICKQSLVIEDNKSSN